MTIPDWVLWRRTGHSLPYELVTGLRRGDRCWRNIRTKSPIPTMAADTSAHEKGGPAFADPPISVLDFSAT